jgi:putative DNA primase/helicase
MSDDRLAVVADLAVARKRNKDAAAVAADATHHDMALAWLSAQDVGEHGPVFSGGAFYMPHDDGLWREKTLEQAQGEIAASFNGRKHCKRRSDYTQIAAHASVLVDEPSFFANAPVGVTTPSGFHTVGSNKRCEVVSLDLSHRQQFRLAWDPDEDAEPVRLNQLLEDAFAGDCAEDQIDLVWQALGAIVFGLLPAHQVVVMLLGREKSGKSTLQRLVESVLPPAAVSAVSPAVWSREYNVASMAGKRLNVVGELADDAPIPAAAFKNVTGGNLIEGRHPTHRPFYFTCQASHLFASNVLPPTTDRTEAFFRRWRVLRFSNRVADERADPELLTKIIRDEMPGFLAYAFRGVERLCQAGKLRSTPAHEAVIAKWRAAANPVLQFLLDTEWVTLDPAARHVSTRDAYAAYRKWASEVGMRNPFGRNHFLDLIDSTGAQRGVGRSRPSGGVEVVVGLWLVDREGQP